MTKPNDYALIIGVHDYHTYDPSGNADVPGARNDARAWFRVCLSMGFSPENIRVLTSPPLTPADLGPEAANVTFGAATRAGIVEGLTWLSASIGGDAPVSGLLTFTGHGSEGEGGMPLLCPTDTTPSLEEVIDVAVLREKSSAKVRDNLTIMLDCCHAQVGTSAATTLRAKLAARSAGIHVPEAARARVVAACRRDQQSVTSRFLGEEMGAFTWAATSALGQWRTVDMHGVAALDVSYGDLALRTRALLSALSFEQEPVVSGPAGVAKLAFLHPGTAGEREETNRAPTATRKGLQLDGGQIPAGRYRKYEVRCYTSANGWSLMAEIYVTTTDTSVALPRIGNTQMQPGMEYWVFSGTETAGPVSAWQEHYSITLDLQMPCQGDFSSDISVGSYRYCFEAREAVSSWTQVGRTTPPPDSSFVFSGGSGTIKGIALQYQGDTLTNWWWMQTGQRNLTNDDMNSATLFPRSASPSSEDSYAASAFMAFDPNG